MNLLDVTNYIPATNGPLKRYQFFMFAGVAFIVAWAIHQTYSLVLLSLVALAISHVI